jgi:subtilisin
MSAVPPRPAWTRGESIFAASTADLVSIPMITPEWAWGGASGRGVRVAVLDSGIQADHPALEGCVDADAGIALRLSEDGEVLEEPGPHEDLFGHGTACAGIIHRLAPEARITSVRVLGQALTGRSKVFLRALAWAIAEGYDVINLSLSTSKRDWALAFYEICDEAYFRRCFVVTSADNRPGVTFPSLYSSVASVACNLASEPFEFYANPEPPTEFLAPGIDVEVPWADGRTMRVTGNSFAAPHISGIAALICSKHPGLRPFEIKSALMATAANLPGEALGSLPRIGQDATRIGLSARTRSAIGSQP